MLLRFGNIVYDLKYCEKIVLFELQHISRLYLRFCSGEEEKIDLREYNCEPKELFEQIYNSKNSDNVMLRLEKKEDKKDVS
jgi:hypothetical protein